MSNTHNTPPSQQGSALSGPSVLKADEGDQAADNAAHSLLGLLHWEEVMKTEQPCKLFLLQKGE